MSIDVGTDLLFEVKFNFVSEHHLSVDPGKLSGTVYEGFIVCHPFSHFSLIVSLEGIIVPNNIPSCFDQCIFYLQSFLIGCLVTRFALWTELFE